MTDQELLTYAAKAAGYSNPTWDDDIWLHDESKELHQWNPLENDADAFQLMVKCHIDLVFGKGDVESSFTPAKGYFEEVFLEFYKDDESKMSAARRVIVMAAAEIGRAIK